MEFSFSQWVESRYVQDSMNHTLARELNKRGLTPDNITASHKLTDLDRPDGPNTSKWHLNNAEFQIVNPNSLEGANLASDHRVVTRDGAYAQYVDGSGWMPLSSELMPRGGRHLGLGNKINKIPNMRQPKVYDPLDPTSPENDVRGSTQYLKNNKNVDDLHYDRPTF